MRRMVLIIVLCCAVAVLAVLWVKVLAPRFEANRQVHVIYELPRDEVLCALAFVSKDMIVCASQEKGKDYIDGPAHIRTLTPSGRLISELVLPTEYIGDTVEIAPNSPLCGINYRDGDEYRAAIIDVVTGKRRLLSKEFQIAGVDGEVFCPAGTHILLYDRAADIDGLMLVNIDSGEAESSLLYSTSSNDFVQWKDCRTPGFFYVLNGQVFDGHSKPLGPRMALDTGDEYTESVSPDMSKYVLSAGHRTNMKADFKYTLSVYDIATGRLMNQIKRPTSVSIGEGITWSHSGNKLALVERRENKPIDGSILFYSQPTTLQRVPVRSWVPTRRIAWSPDSKHLAGEVVRLDKNGLDAERTAIVLIKVP